MIRFMLLQNRAGKTRLAKYYVPIPDAEKRKLEYEIHRSVVSRDPKHTNLFEVRRPPKKRSFGRAGEAMGMARGSSQLHALAGEALRPPPGHHQHHQCGYCSSEQRLAAEPARRHGGGPLVAHASARRHQCDPSSGGTPWPSSACCCAGLLHQRAASSRAGAVGDGGPSLVAHASARRHQARSAVATSLASQHAAARGSSTIELQSWRGTEREGGPLGRA